MGGGEYHIPNTIIMETLEESMVRFAKKLRQEASHQQRWGNQAAALAFDEAAKQAESILIAHNVFIPPMNRRSGTFPDSTYAFNFTPRLECSHI